MGWRRGAACGAALIVGAAAAFAALSGQAQTPEPGPRPPAVEPVVKGAHWHHIHLNATDPQAAVEFYTRHFDAKPATFAGREPAVWTQKSWILLDKVRQPPSIKLNTAIWHMGWGTEEPKAEYERQKGLGSTFFTPLTDISINNGGAPDRFYFMYVQGPDRMLIELNTAAHHHFGHVHLFSEDPVAAGDWYIKTFGLTGRALSTPQTSRAPRYGKNGLQIGPLSSLYLDNVNLIIYPAAYARKAYADDWRGISELQSPRGHVNDHIAVSVPNLEAALKALEGAGVKVTQRPKALYGGQLRSAFIEGPDHIAIEVVEDHSGHPPIEG